jgi:hypothetical protein
VFRALSPTVRDTSADRAATGEGTACFRPSCWSDDRNGGNANRSSGRDLAAHLEEVQGLAFQRGLDSGREEAVRMAQASLLPHLKSLIQNLNALIHQIEDAESHTSRHAVSLARTIVEQVIGATAGPYDFDELENALGQAILQGNQIQFRMNQEDWAYLQELSENDRLAWPGNASVVFQGDPDTARGHFQILEQNQPGETIEDHVERYFTALRSKTGDPI